MVFLGLICQVQDEVKRASLFDGEEVEKARNSHTDEKGGMVEDQVADTTKLKVSERLRHKADVMYWIEAMLESSTGNLEALKVTFGPLAP